LGVPGLLRICYPQSGGRVAGPEERFVNATLSGASPLRGSARKSASGAWVIAHLRRTRPGLLPPCPRQSTPAD